MLGYDETGPPRAPINASYFEVSKKRWIFFKKNKKTFVKNLPN